MPLSTGRLTDARLSTSPRGQRADTGSSQLKITGSDSPTNTPIPSSLHLGGYMARNIQDPASALPSAAELWKAMVAGFGRNRPSVRDRFSTLLCRAIFNNKTDWSVGAQNRSEPCSLLVCCTGRESAPYPSVLRDAAGNIIGGINLLVDITGRKNAEMEANEQFRAIVEATPECVEIVAPDGTCCS